MDLSRESDDNRCRHCGAHVSRDFARTFGDEDGRVHRCLACDSRARLQKGSGAGCTVGYPDPEDQEGRNHGPRVRASTSGVVRGDER
ncbi:DUF7563 family protein [Halobellus inordinatus]|uniref:DUF7563 family protein n=1 Tax=Halobellus inordinatus TaxID=1126236 RepID=UPI00210C7513|nr:hypothetical protein [Halobellus inordinatus]